MSSISNRINDLVNHFSNGNVSKFSAKVGFSEANVRNYINGTQPKSEFLSKLIEVFEINAEWLLTGKELMLKSEVKEMNTETSITNDIEVKLLRIIIDTQNALILELREKIKNLEEGKN